MKSHSYRQSSRYLPVMLLLVPFQFIFGLIYSWGTISPAIHNQSGWPQATLDLAFSLTPLALLPAVTLAGHGLRRISPKALLAVALTCFMVGGAIGLAPGGSIPFILGYSIIALGVGGGLSTAACIAMVSRLYPQRRGSLGGALLATYGMSSVLSAPLFHLLDSYFGWRVALALLLSLYSVVGWLAWFGLPDLSVEEARKLVHVSLRTMLSHRSMQWAIALVLIAAPLGSASFATVGHLASDLGFGPEFALGAVAAMAIGNGLGRLGFGALADHRGGRFSRNAVLAVNALGAALLLAALHGQSTMLFVPYPLLMGLAFGGMAGKLPAMAAHIVKDGHAETVFGLLFGSFAFASFLGPVTSATFGMPDALQGLAVAAIVAWLLSFVAV